jgi:methylase of polypeptide subunit release factors
MTDSTPAQKSAAPKAKPPVHAASESFQTIHWVAQDQPQSAVWRSENGWAPPKRCIVADDTMTADIAYRHASEGVGLIWTGDFQNARQLLQALGRRTAKRRVKYADMPYPDRFHQVRLARAQRARTLGMLLLPVQPGHVLHHRRAPDVTEACLAAYGQDQTGYVVPMTELMGVISAFEWRKKGVHIPALHASIHAHYGVFAPVRAEYLDLIVRAKMGRITQAFDIGTGTGVIAALLAERGIEHVIATDSNPKAIECARENIRALKLENQIKLREADLFPEGQADLIVCNPPWLPGRPASSLEHAIYDQDQRMLKGLLQGAGAHLKPEGEVWLILSDLAEHLRLRSRVELLALFDDAGLDVIERLDTRPVHPKSKDEEDPLADARRQEVTSLWRLKVQAQQ